MGDDRREPTVETTNVAGPERTPNKPARIVDKLTATVCPTARNTNPAATGSIVRLAEMNASASDHGAKTTADRAMVGVAMGVGLLLGRLIPGLNTALDKVQVDGISLPIALGLLIMMYPVLA
jgi:hypothetical protein